MENMSVKQVVQENKKNAKAFSVFMDERIINDDIGPRLDQFLANARERGLYPLLGGDYYKPLQEGVIVICPKSWGTEDVCCRFHSTSGLPRENGMTRLSQPKISLQGASEDR